jgi:hypothetical protein
MNEDDNQKKTPRELRRQGTYVFITSAWVIEVAWAISSTLISSPAAKTVSTIFSAQ